MASFKDLCEVHSSLKLLLHFNAAAGGVDSVFSSEKTPEIPYAQYDDSFITNELHGAPGITVCAFIRPANLSGSKRILTFSIGGGSMGFRLQQSNSVLSVNARSVSTDSTQFDTSVATFTVNTYSFAAGAIDVANDEIITYLDGTYRATSVSFGQASVVDYSSPSDLYVGHDNGGSRFDGRMPVMALFNSVLTESELSAIEAADSSGFSGSSGGDSGASSGPIKSVSAASI